MNNKTKVINKIKTLLDQLICILAFLFPLDPHMIILANHGLLHLDSNNFFFLRYLKDCRKRDKIIPYKIFMITNNHALKGNLDPKKLRDLFVILQCKNFLITHGSGDFFWTKIGKDPRRLFLMLFHGNNFKAGSVTAHYKEWKYKRDFYKEEKAFNKNKKLIIDKFSRIYWITGSKLERYLVSASNRFPLERCISIGYPRNEIYYSQSLVDKPWESLVKSYINSFDKVILYAPTWRLFSANPPPYLPFLDDFSLDRLENILQKHNAILIYRHHINTKQVAETFHEKLKSPFIKNISFQVLPYVSYLLKYTDILITDYSGIIYDFIFLNRPMIALANDWKHYNLMRGYRLKYNRVFPGKITKNFTELLKTIEEYLQNPQKDSQMRKFWYRLFRDFSDGKNAHRTYLLLQRLNNEPESQLI